MGYALGGPEQLGQFPFGQGLTREFSDRPPARQRFFERHLPPLLRRRKSQDTCRTGFGLDHSGTHGWRHRETNPASEEGNAKTVFTAQGTSGISRFSPAMNVPREEPLPPGTIRHATCCPIRRVWAAHIEDTSRRPT